MTIDYAKFKAHPTRYKGRQYRSRLEARWAAWFDLMGWSVEYEPFDLSGWVPDFLIRGNGVQVLVEVKPIEAFTEADEARQKMERAVRAEWDGPYQLMILGHSWPVSSCFAGFPSFGWLAEGSHHTWEWGCALITGNDDAMGFFHDYMSYTNRITGEHDGDHHLVIPSLLPARRWILAANAVQWKFRGQL